jgi:hypothetical protein
VHISTFTSIVDSPPQVERDLVRHAPRSIGGLSVNW